MRPKYRRPIWLAPTIALAFIVVAAHLRADVAPPPDVVESCAETGRGVDPSPLVPEPIAYTSFYSGQLLQEFGWVGEHVAILTQDTNRDPCAMRRIVHVADQIYAWYAEMTGREPNPNVVYNGRATVAMVSDLPGAGYGLFANTGIELVSTYFESLYAGVRDANQFDPPVSQAARQLTAGFPPADLSLY